MGSRRHVKIDGDSRNGTLFAEGAVRYIGTRRIAGGRFEERTFSGVEHEVRAEWREWRDETVERETIHVGRGMSARKYSAEKPIAGNTRDGRLYSTGQQRHYVGERPGRNGKLERRQFDNVDRDEAMALWQEWRGETVVERAQKEEEVEAPREDALAAKTQQQGKRREVMYVLAFKAQRAVKNVALFSDMDAALRMADSLTVALEVTGTDGEYDVSELEVWG